MGPYAFDFEEIERLVRLAADRGLAELVVEEGGTKLTVRGHRVYSVPQAPAAPVSVYAPPPAIAPNSTLVAAPAVVPVPEEGRVAIEAPMIGVFYRSTGPDQPSFVEAGDHVSVGQTIGLIEAMKVFSEIPSEVAGTVVDIPVKNGQLVRPGDAILYLLPD